MGAWRRKLQARAVATVVRPALVLASLVVATILVVALLVVALVVPAPGALPAAAVLAPSALAPPPAALEAVSCPTAQRCVAVGGPGDVLVSRTGGRTWTRVATPTRHYLYGVACGSPTHCVAVGDAGTALVSYTGGRTWRLGDTGVAQPLSSVACPTPAACDAVGDHDTVIDTGDGGLQWHTANGGLGVLDAVACSTASRCVAVSSIAGMDLATADGHQWVSTTVPFTGLDDLFAMSGVACAALNCLAVGAGGLVARSDDGGTSWAPLASVTPVAPEAVACPTASSCIAVGAGGKALVTTDAGETWTQEQTSTGETLLGVDCVASGSCVAVGSGGTVVTTGDGVHWSVRAGRPVPAAGLRVLIVGDSFSRTVAYGLQRNGAAYGMTAIDGGLDGCSLARGSPILLDGHSSPVGGACAPTGPGWQAQYAADVASQKPTLSLIVLGPWDLSTRFINGSWQTPGQAGYDSYYVRQVRAAIRILSAGGGRVAIGTVTAVRASGPFTCVPLPAEVPDCPDQRSRATALDAAARHAAAAFGGRVAVIPLGHRLAPQGKFTLDIDGVVVRAADGVHLSEPGGEWLTRWLVPRLEAAVQ